MKRVEVTTVAMMSGAETGGGRASRFSGRLAQLSGELVKVEKKRDARAKWGSCVVVTKIVCRDDGSLCSFKKNLYKGAQR